ncbi:MAG: hypothetical protein RIS70_2151, partial [Planctomycetota bacterium]
HPGLRRITGCALGLLRAAPLGLKRWDVADGGDFCDSQSDDQIVGPWYPGLRRSTGCALGLLRVAPLGV